MRIFRKPARRLAQKSCFPSSLDTPVGLYLHFPLKSGLLDADLSQALSKGRADSRTLGERRLQNILPPLQSRTRRPGRASAPVRRRPVSPGREAAEAVEREFWKES